MSCDFSSYLGYFLMNCPGVLDLPWYYSLTSSLLFSVLYVVRARHIKEYYTSQPVNRKNYIFETQTNRKHEYKDLSPLGIISVLNRATKSKHVQS